MDYRDNEYSGMKVLIMGLGLNGGNIEAAIYLGLRGADLCITDLRDEKALAPSIERLEEVLSGTGKKIRYVLGHHEFQDFKQADIVIKNPGVRPDSPYLEHARHIETDISLFLAASPGRLIAVTGSKGKSSISSALHWALKNWAECKNNPDAGKHRAYLGGNITLSPLNFLDELTKDDDVVLELSSWQLGDLGNRLNKKNGRALLKPRAAVISAIMPDHLDRYGTMDAYIADKRIIYRGQEKDDVIVTEDDSWGRSFRWESRARPLVYSGSGLPKGVPGGWIDESGCGLARLREDEIAEVVPQNILVPGKHQKKNLLAAALALLDLGLPAEFINEQMGTFPGIEHRLEFFLESGGIFFYNDSAATIPEAAAAAIHAFDRPPVLVCGGSDKNLDFTPLAKNAGAAASVFLLEGSGSAKLIPMLKAEGVLFKGPFDSLDAAVKAVLEKTRPGDIVVLSPGCTSFGMFLNEFDRGNKWKEAMRRIAGNHGS